MNVKEVMTPNVRIADPDQSIYEIAKLMRDDGFGVMPVGENDRLIGMITDRDICCRAVADKMNPEKTTVRDIMSEEMLYCFEDEDIDDVVDKMAKQQVRRFPVLNSNKRLVGIISLGDIALAAQNKQVAGEAISAVSKHSEKHTQH